MERRRPPRRVRRLRLLHTALLLLLCLIGGCYSQTYDTHALPGRQVRVQQSYWLFGLYGWAIIDESQHCPEGLAKVVNESAPSDVVLSVISLGVWMPRTLYLYCRTISSKEPS